MSTVCHMSDQEIIVAIEPGTALRAFTSFDDNGRPNGLDNLLARVRSEIDGFTADISTPAGRAAIASMAFKVSKAKAALEREGKTLADQQKEIPKKIDASRKYMRDTLDLWHDEVRKPLDEWEAAEERRIEDHKIAIAALARPADISFMQTTLDCHEATLAELEAFTIGLDCEEFAADYARARDASIAKTRENISLRAKYDRDQEELARLRREEEERQRIEAEERLRREGEERANRAAAEKVARERREADEKAERDRRQFKERQHEQQRQIDEANQRAELAAKAERDRIAEEQRRAEEEQRKRKENRRHCAQVNRAAANAFLSAGILADEETAKKVVALIARGEVPRVKILY